MNSKVTSILILLVFFSFPLKADLAESLLKNGNREYTEKNYTAAAEEYRKIISMGVHNSTVYYNLGNALYRSGELGRALLAYEKAFLLDPGDKEILKNLKFARLSVIDQRPEPEFGLIRRILWKLHSVFNIQTSFIILTICNFLLGILICLFILSPPGKREIFVYPSILIVFLVVFTAPSFFYKVLRRETVKEAVVLKPELEVLNEPDGESRLFTVHEGTKFSIEKRKNKWVLVSLPGGMGGWVPLKNLGIIEID